MKLIVYPQNSNKTLIKWGSFPQLPQTKICTMLLAVSRGKSRYEQIWVEHILWPHVPSWALTAALKSSQSDMGNMMYGPDTSAPQWPTSRILAFLPSGGKGKSEVALRNTSWESNIPTVLNTEICARPIWRKRWSSGCRNCRWLFRKSTARGTEYWSDSDCSIINPCQ
jgi:hypothetical protein